MNNKTLKKMSMVFLSIIAVLGLAFAFTLIAKTSFTASAETVAEQTEEVSVMAESGEAEEEADNSKSGVAIAAGIAVGIAAGAGAIGMGMAVSKASESMARQPEIKGDIRSNMMLGLVFIETAIIYALVVAILLIFVL